MLAALENYTLLKSITELGDSGVLAVISILTSVFLFFSRSYRAGFAMLLAFVLAAGSTTIAKLIFLGCVEDGWLGIRSPSGHTTISLSVYSMLALLVSSQLRQQLKLLPHLLCLLLISGIAMSRITLGHHTVEEVLIGLMIGVCAVVAASMLLFYKRTYVDRFNVWFLLALIGGAALVLYGTHLPAEQFIKQLAAMMKHYFPVCA